MNSKTENHIRSFGMSGYLVTEELKQIEGEFSIDLGHVKGDIEEGESCYYPQFEQSVRAEANRMSQYYELFYCLESSIRKLLTETLADTEGGTWWDSERITPSIRVEVDKRIQKEVDNSVTRRSDNKIDYTTFGELAVIITGNWDIFATIFSSRRAVERVMSSLNLLRGPIAHCCPITEDEVDRLHLTVKDWFRTMA
jgi:hypothetical protein